MTLNGLSMANANAFDTGARVLDSMPLLFALECFIIYIPLIFHAAYGLFIMGYSRVRGMPNYVYTRNAMFWWQRFSGIVLIFFIGWHAITIRFGVLNVNFITESDPTFKVIAALFNPVVYAAYIVGVIATSYHFCNGLFTAGLTWGITVGPKAQAAASRFWMLMFLAMSALWICIATTFFLGSPNGLIG